MNPYSYPLRFNIFVVHQVTGSRGNVVDIMVGALVDTSLVAPLSNALLALADALVNAEFVAALINAALGASLIDAFRGR